MAGRASVFSHPTVIQLAGDQFVPVAENSSGLQHQQDDKGVFFRHVAEQGHYGGRIYPTATRQGSYAFTADGRFLASINSRDPDAMVGMLRSALDRWRDGDGGSAPAPVQLTAGAPARDAYPADGLVLKVAARDLPREFDERPDDWRKTAWNMDYAWFLCAEAEALVPEAREVGVRRAAPLSVCRRLARFHLRDFVRGEPFAWPAEAIRHAELWSEIAGIDGPDIHLVLRGAIRLEHEAHWIRPEDGEERRSPCGLDASLYGEAVWDGERGAFTAFDLLAVGPRWGTNQYNNRADDLGPAPLGIAFALAGNTPAERTPPHCLRTWRTPGDGPLKHRVMVERSEYFR